MIFFLIIVGLFVWIFRRYCGWIVSSILSLVARCPISVGDVRWLRLSDVRFRLRNGVSVHIDEASLQFFPQQVSKPILIRFGDVRIEADSQLLPKESSKGGTGGTSLSRFLHLVQYCGLSVTSIQLVLFEVIPECMLHVTVDELSAEAFRSREGWQLELSCRLAQGKLLRRKEAPERLLANWAVSLQLSIDVTSSGLNRLGLRLADPSINLYRGILDVVRDLKERHPKSAESEGVPVLAKLQKISDATVSISNCTVVYTGISNEQRRSLSLRISEVEIEKKNGITAGKVVGLSLADFMNNTVISSGLLSTEITESSPASVDVKLCSDSVVTSVLLQDVLWWKLHFAEAASCLKSFPKEAATVTRTRQSEVAVTWIVELDSVHCNFSDGDALQSTVSVQLLTFSKNASEWELGAESLLVADPAKTSASASYEHHQWGHTAYVGVAILSYVSDPVEPSLLVCVDDFKAEWSDKLAASINRLVQSLAELQPKTPRSSDRRMTVKLKSKRTSLVCIANDATYLLCMTEELALERNGTTDLVCSAKSTRIGISTVTAEGVHLEDLLRAERIMPSKEDGEETPRCWSQAAKDRKRLEKREAFEQRRNLGIKLIGEASLFCVSVESTSSTVTRDVTISSNAPIYVCWSPLIHRVIYHLRTGIKEAFTSRKKADSVRVPPRIMQLKVLTNHSVELDMDLPRYHRMVWKIPSLTLDKSANGLSALSPQLTITMNGYEIVNAVDVCITKRLSDQRMDACRQAFGDLLQPHNKVWTWAAESFVFMLPFQFNFHQVFDEFINCIKWIKIVHGVTKKAFTAESPLPADIRIVFKEARLEMEDDPFENLLQSSHELREDEVYECERRRQMLAERLATLKKTSPLFPQSKLEELLASLQAKNSNIYIERWKKQPFALRPLFISSWEGFEIRALADPSLHGTDICLDMMHEFDPQSFFPTGGLNFSTLWGRAVEFDMAEWKIQFKDYPHLYLDAKDIHFFGNLVGAEHFEEGGRSLRESTVDLPAPWETHTVLRNMSPLKFYYDMQCEAGSWNLTYGPCWEPCLAMISMLWNNISAPSRDPSPPLPFWDKMRFLLHGRFSWLCTKMVTTMLASPDPYNQTETVEFSWENLGLDWALGEIRIRCALRVFIRTASRYDDSRIISLPDLKLRINLDWICGGDPHDHHSVTLCAPHRLPHYSTDHDSYRAFRSRCLDLGLSFDVGAGSGSGDSMPQCLFYANTFRCVEYLMKTLTTKNRPIRRGPIFGTPFYNKPQISKHFRTVQVSLNLPKFFITYWMSHSSDFGFRITSDGLNLLGTLKLTTVASTDKEITRRAVHVWSPEHVSATLWGTQVQVFGSGGQSAVEKTDEEEISEESLLLAISRVSYVRENNAGRDTAKHRLTAHDLKASWTAEIRDACLAIADGIHRAHLLRRILSNDAIKILNLHQEGDQKESQMEYPASRQDSYIDERGHRRGYSLSDTNQSMLDQLIEESSTRLVAHCEQTTDLPTDSLQGVQQCTMDDVLAIHWQIDLLNSQLVLKGSERGGFVLLTAARASLAQKIHKNVWRSGQLLGKKSWSAVISGMQYFAPVGGMPSAGCEKIPFRFLPREVIEEKATDSSEDYLSHFVADGEAVGGVVQPGLSSDLDRYQFQRIVSRCSCGIYFCYFSENMKADALEETAVPKMEAEPVFGREEGLDCLTVKHNMLEASTSSEQYEMLVDIANTLVLFIDPKKKELAENRRRIRFACEMIAMEQMRQSIVEQQSDLRDIVAVVRSLERQLFHLDTQSDLDEAELEAKRRELTSEMEEYKQKQLEVSDQLAIYISCYKQRQVEATLAVVRKPEEDGLPAVARRFEVCFEDCIWRLTESDGQIALSEIQIRNFLYTRMVNIDNSGSHLFEVGSVRISNLLPDSIYKDTLHRDDRLLTRQPAIRLLLRDLAPVGGICVKEHFEVNIAPMVVQLTYEFFEKMMGFFFPGKNIHKDDQLENVEEATPGKFSFTRRITGSLSMRSNKTVQVERKSSTLNGKQNGEEIDDIERMRQRAHDNNFFLYIKIPEVPFVVSYKGVNDKNIEDIDRFGFTFPLCEFHERNWTWLDLSLAVKQRCKRVLLQQFMRQKLLRNRLLTGAPEPVEGMTEEDKKRIALGATSGTFERKKKK